jgi:hypothetical protein
LKVIIIIVLFLQSHALFQVIWPMEFPNFSYLPFFVFEAWVCFHCEIKLSIACRYCPWPIFGWDWSKGGGGDHGSDWLR